MRFHFGSAPEGPVYASAAQGWQQTPALGVKRVQNYGLLVSCAGMLFVAILLKGNFRPGSLLSALLILVVTMPLHELIHALTTPGWGLTNQTVIGLQSGKGLLLPYMYYDGSQPLWHMLLTGLAPTLLLTVLPVIIILTTSLSSALRADLGFLAFFNVAISGGDLVNFLWIVTHLPLHATVQRNGWGLQWKG